MDEQRDIVAVDERVFNIIDYLSEHPFLFMGFSVGSGLLLTCMSIGIILDNKFTNKGER